MADTQAIEEHEGLFTLVDDQQCSPQLINQDLKPTT